MAEDRVVLLVDDNPNDVELTVRGLAEYHLANPIAVVGDGAEALDYLYQRGAYSTRPPGPPAVVLLDVRMPKVDGLEVLRQIKTDEQLQTIPVVMLTFTQDDPILAECYRLGVHAYVLKPADFQALVQVTRELDLFWLLTDHPA